MIRKILLVGAGLAALAASTQASAQSSASTSGTASVTILAPIAVSETSTLAFGKVASGTTLTVPNTGGAATVNTGALISSTRSAGEFKITGEVGQTFSFSLPNSGTVTLTDGNSAHDMSATLSAAATSGTIVSGGTLIKVGGVLAVPTGQTAGTYNGTYVVTAAYN